MKKLFLLLFISLFHCHNSYCQNISFSEPFEEPTEGYNKVIQLSNGNTFHLFFTNKDGIEVTVYDKTHKAIAEKNIESDLWEKKLTHTRIHGVYEIKGQVVIFMEQTLSRTPYLFRVILDPNTGSKIDDKQIGEMGKYALGAGYAMYFGKVKESEFYVEKDPYSDCYAVAAFDGFAHETGRRILVDHYDGNHKLINHAYYGNIENKFKYIDYLSMTVIGDKEVVLCTYGYNGILGESSDKSVSISKLSNGDSVFVHKPLHFSDDFKNTYGMLTYNDATNQIYLLTVTLDHRGVAKEYYKTIITYIDPETLMVTANKLITGQKASQYLTAHSDYKKGFRGLAQNMIVNKDNTLTVAMEEMAVVEHRMGSGASAGYSIETVLGNIGVCQLDTKGDEIDGYAIPKYQSGQGELQPLYQYHKAQGMWRPSLARSGYHENMFMSYDYVSTHNNKYVIFNDLPANDDKDEDRGRKKVVGVSKTNTICYKIKNGDIEKNYLFGDLKDEDNRFCYIESSNFSKVTDTYATVIVERDGRKKQSRIAWVTLD
jgi:hypothetical protein